MVAEVKDEKLGGVGLNGGGSEERQAEVRLISRPRLVWSL